MSNNNKNNKFQIKIFVIVIFILFIFLYIFLNYYWDYQTSVISIKIYQIFFKITHQL